MLSHACSRVILSIFSGCIITLIPNSALNYINKARVQMGIFFRLIMGAFDPSANARRVIIFIVEMENATCWIPKVSWNRGVVITIKPYLNTPSKILKLILWWILGPCEEEIEDCTGTPCFMKSLQELQVQCTCLPKRSMTDGGRCYEPYTRGPCR